MHLQQKEHKGRPLCSLAYAYNLLMKRQKKKEKEKTEMSLKGAMSAGEHAL